MQFLPRHMGEAMCQNGPFWAPYNVLCSLVGVRFCYGAGVQASRLGGLPVCARYHKSDITLCCTGLNAMATFVGLRKAGLASPWPMCCCSGQAALGDSLGGTVHERDVTTSSACAHILHKQGTPLACPAASTVPGDRRGGQTPPLHAAVLPYLQPPDPCPQPTRQMGTHYLYCRYRRVP